MIRGGKTKDDLEENHEGMEDSAGLQPISFDDQDDVLQVHTGSYFCT